ncbi:MAG: acyltransferase family protein [Xanthobacteraceae bacterium]
MALPRHGFPRHGAAATGDQRVDWVDYAKGFCIIFVVMMHSTLGVENIAGREGWLHVVVAFAKPFRMPDFFLISGLFLARVIDRDWRIYLDRKVVHFAYFYLLWTAIQFAVKAPVFVQEHGVLSTVWLYAQSFWEPFGTLWFIYLLPIFFVVSKLAHGLRIPPLLVWLGAATLEIAHAHTGGTVVDEFASRFVYFYTGYLLAPRIFGFAKHVGTHPEIAFAGLVAWGLANGLLVFNGLAELPLVSLGLGLAGACAVVATSTLLARSGLATPLRYCGRNSIVVYLAFFLPMAASRALLLKSGLVSDIGAVCVLVTLAGVAGALAWFWAVRRTPLRFLFERPDFFRFAPNQRLVLQPAQ